MLHGSCQNSNNNNNTIDYTIQKQGERPKSKMKEMEMCDLCEVYEIKKREY
jgi:hypothetical protein